jgi:RNA polymerase sigma factor (sigma-70 family)
MEPRELLLANLALIERAVSFACRRYRLERDDAEEFAAIVNLRLVDNDYAILRAYEGRSGFATYISIVVQRMVLDYRIHEWGKWRASAEAKRIGEPALELEKLLHRDHRSLEEAFVALSPRHPTLTLGALRELAERLPARAAKRRDVGVEQAESVAATRIDAVEEPLLAKERASASQKLSGVVSSVIDAMPEEDRLILQLRFEGGMTVAQIARALQLDQRLLYRRLETSMRELRRQLERLGVGSRDALDLVGRDETELHFRFARGEARPSEVST